MTVKIKELNITADFTRTNVEAAKPKETEQSPKQRDTFSLRPPACFEDHHKQQRER